jgi:APA family basic amino acid/polyamine antiporter
MGLLAAVLLCAGWTIGSGIFRLPSEVAAGTGSAGLSLLFWLLGGVFAFFGALCYAELAVRLPRSGAEFVYLDAAFGPGPAFLCGCAYLLSSPATIAAVARVFADYAAILSPLSEWQRRILAAGLIAALAVVVTRSTRAGSVVVSAATIGKLAAIAVVVGAAMLAAPAASTAGAAIPAAGPRGATDLALAFAAIIFAYDGFQSVTQLGGEVRDPRRSLPRAILLGTLVVTVTYLLLNVAYLRTLGLAGVRASPAVAAETAGALIGAIGSVFVAGLVMLSTLGSAAAQLLGNPRVVFAMAEERLFFRPFALIGRHTETPWVAITFMAAVAIVLVLAGGYAFLTRVAVLTSYPISALTMLGIPRLRRRDGPPDGFRMPLYPLPIIAYVATILTVWGLSLVGDPAAALCGVIVMLAGAAAYRVWRRCVPSRPRST